METNVFNRTALEGKEISASLYNFIIGAVLCWGFLVNWVMIDMVSPAAIASVNPWLFFIGYAASCFFGVYLFRSSDNPFISFIGYNFVVVPFGFVINLAVSRFNPSIVQEAVQITGFVTGFMMILGTIFPAFFKRIIGALSISLIAVIIIELIMALFFGKTSSIFDFIVVIIFCGYIGYDWARANSIPRTVDNAVDSAAALYMDIIILFLRILSILGRRD